MKIITAMDLTFDIITILLHAIIPVEMFSMLGVLIMMLSSLIISFGKITPLIGIIVIVLLLLTRMEFLYPLDTIFWKKNLLKMVYPGLIIQTIFIPILSFATHQKTTLGCVVIAQL